MTPVTEDIRRVLQHHEQSGNAFVGVEDPPDASILTGFVLVGEWRSADGRRWLFVVSSDAVGEEATTWAIRGWLHEALYFWKTGD